MARPKKVILSVDSHPDAQGVRVFLLETKGFRLLTAATAQGAVEILEASAPGTIHLMIVDALLPGVESDTLCLQAKARDPFLQTLLVNRTSKRLGPQGADMVLPKSLNSADELLERVRILTSRKRGPRKKIQPVSAGVQEALEKLTA